MKVQRDQNISNISIDCDAEREQCSFLNTNFRKNTHKNRSKNSLYTYLSNEADFDSEVHVNGCLI